MTLLTVTPPLTDAAMWLQNPGPPGAEPGSKKPEPVTWVPVICTFTDDCPGATGLGLAVDGVAGGGGCSLITRRPQEFVEFAYSWKVQKVMLSVGSTTVCE